MDQNAVRTLGLVIGKGFFPKRVSLFIGLVCNLQCPYCYLPYKTRLNDEMLISDILGALKDNGVAEIEILGGEPFVYENRLKAALKYIQNTGMQLKAISTNGIIYNEKCVRLLSSTKELDFFQVSVDAATSETYKIIRPPGNNFDKVIANIRKFVAKGLPVSMSFVITKINAREISSFY